MVANKQGIVDTCYAPTRLAAAAVIIDYTSINRQRRPLVTQRQQRQSAKDL